MALARMEERMMEMVYNDGPICPGYGVYVSLCGREDMAGTL